MKCISVSNRRRCQAVWALCFWEYIIVSPTHTDRILCTWNRKMNPRGFCDWPWHGQESFCQPKNWVRSIYRPCFHLQSEGFHIWEGGRLGSIRFSVSACLSPADRHHLSSSWGALRALERLLPSQNLKRMLTLLGWFSLCPALYLAVLTYFIYTWDRITLLDSLAGGIVYLPYFLQFSLSNFRFKVSWATGPKRRWSQNSPRSWPLPLG